MSARARRGGVIALLVVLVLATALVLALAAARSGQGRRLDPANPAPEGGRALAQILQDHGISVRVVTRSTELGPGDSGTILVTDTETLGPAQLLALRSTSASLVLVEPDQRVLDALAPSIRLEGVAADENARDPGCSAPAATRAGQIIGGGLLYQGGDDAQVCYTDPGSTTDDPGTGTYVVQHQITVIGQGDLLTNADLATEGDAALAIDSLNLSSSLTWYTPDPLENGSGDDDQSLIGLVPPAVWWTLALLGLAVLLAMFWRGRRMGRLVYEPLPVVVSAAETQLGRARLYRQARARGRAADTIRTAALRRLAHRLAAPQAAAPADLVQLVAAATGRPEPEVGSVLLGPAPATDLELVQLANQLDHLETLATLSISSPITDSSTAGAGRP